MNHTNTKCLLPRLPAVTMMVMYILSILVSCSVATAVPVVDLLKERTEKIESFMSKRSAAVSRKASALSTEKPVVVKAKQHDEPKRTLPLDEADSFLVEPFLEHVREQRATREAQQGYLRGVECPKVGVCKLTFTPAPTNVR